MDSHFDVFSKVLATGFSRRDAMKWLGGSPFINNTAVRWLGGVAAATLVARAVPVYADGTSDCDDFCKGSFKERKWEQCREACNQCGGPNRLCGHQGEGDDDEDHVCCCAEGSFCCGMTCCPSTNQCCGTTCTDLSVDVKNCGTCGTACSSGQICSGGRCTTSCSSPKMLCGTVCTDTSTDLSNCGACGTVCPPPPSGGMEMCVSGRCTFTCMGNTTACNGACVSTTTDPRNCGACGNACGTLAPNCCNGACVNLQTDAKNCGKCNNVCPPFTVGIMTFPGACMNGGCAMSVV